MKKIRNIHKSLLYLLLISVICLLALPRGLYLKLCIDADGYDISFEHCPTEHSHHDAGLISFLMDTDHHGDCTDYEFGCNQKADAVVHQKKNENDFQPFTIIVQGNSYIHTPGFTVSADTTPCISPHLISLRTIVIIS
jgi:hypothetical protein